MVTCWSWSLQSSDLSKFLIFDSYWVEIWEELMIVVTVCYHRWYHLNSYLKYKSQKLLTTLIMSVWLLSSCCWLLNIFISTSTFRWSNHINLHEILIGLVWKYLYHNIVYIFFTFFNPHQNDWHLFIHWSMISLIHSHWLIIVFCSCKYFQNWFSHFNNLKMLHAAMIGAKYSQFSSLSFAEHITRS